MRTRSLLMGVALFALFAPCAYAGNTEVGEVALVEDVNGNILSATATPNIWLQRAACQFYTTHGDDYDALFIFNTNPANAMTNNQQGWSVRNPNKGLADPPYDHTANFCAKNKRLRITVSLGGLAGLQPDPDKLAGIVPMYPLTGIELLCHEFGHHWMAGINYDKGDGQGTQCLLRAWAGNSTTPGSTLCNGYDIQGYNRHWSHYLNGCSLMYSNCIEDKGVGSDGKNHFSLSYPVAKYDQLDQYLMGLRTKDEVTDPIFVVDTGDNGSGSDGGPPMHTAAPVDLTGTRVNVTIDDVIRANGAREPALDICHWKAAFILVHAKGAHPSAGMIAAVDAYRKRLETFYPEVTDNRGSFDTTLDGCGTGTATCPGKPSVICGTQPDGDQDSEAEAPLDGDTDTEAAEHEAILPDGDSESTTEPEDGDTSEASDLDKDGTTEPAVDGDTTETGCTPGATRCMRNNPQKCSTNGQTWLDTDDCAALGKVCDSKTVSCVASDGGGSSGGCSGAAGAADWLLPALLGLLAFWPKRRKLLIF